LNTFTVPLSTLYFLTHAAENLLYLIFSEASRRTGWFHTLEIITGTTESQMSINSIYIYACHEVLEASTGGFESSRV